MAYASGCWRILRGGRVGDGQHTSKNAKVDRRIGIDIDGTFTDIVLFDEDSGTGRGVPAI
ncbi:MAG: hypothetical protein QF715_01605 [Pseudomonadales bacterium]|nr:hypothetical protein [Pseudomonadales bacterium]MDP6316692.1 hypothetical protein [Pseudomonadales bacterium]MDP7313451.1 hypothetical protein [Pseudomonadales bacterium]